MFYVKLGRGLTLSKQTQSTDPDTLITLELMQNILLFFSLFKAYSLPTVMAAGRAGGTAIVIKSKDLMIMSDTLMFLVL